MLTSLHDMCSVASLPWGGGGAVCGMNPWKRGMRAARTRGMRREEKRREEEERKEGSVLCCLCSLPLSLFLCVQRIFRRQRRWASGWAWTGRRRSTAPAATTALKKTASAHAGAGMLAWWRSESYGFLFAACAGPAGKRHSTCWLTLAEDSDSWHAASALWLL